MKKQEADFEGHVNINLKPRKGAPNYLANKILNCIADNQRLFKIRISSDEGIYPNFCVPIAGMIRYFEANYGCKFVPSKSVGLSTYVGRTGLLNPYCNTKEVQSDDYLDKVWEFNRDNHYAVVSGIITSLRQHIVMATDVLLGLELCLNEVTDNVLVHSKCSSGFVMAQVHKEQGRIVVAVYDYGVGIATSLASSGVTFSDSKEAVELALQKGITDGDGAGNGLWMLKSIIRMGCGSFEVGTGDILYLYRHKNNIQLSTAAKINNQIEGTTLVDFQLDSGSKLNLNSLFNRGEVTDLWSEAHEEKNDSESCRLLVINEARGRGNRYDAAQFVNVILNAANQFNGSVVVDFDEVEVISMSFADELMMGLVENLGFMQFSSRIKLVNLNALCASIINTVMTNRLSS